MSEVFWIAVIGCVFAGVSSVIYHVKSLTPAQCAKEYRAWRFAFFVMLAAAWVAGVLEVICN